MKKILTRGFLLASILTLTSFVFAQDVYPYLDRTLLLPGEVMQTGVRYSMNGHYITLNPDGNFVVAKEDMSYVWGFDTQGIDYPRVARAVFQEDGNFAVYDADGGYIWSMLTENPDPNARLILTPEGDLQLYSDTNGILWGSAANPPWNGVSELNALKSNWTFAFSQIDDSVEIFVNDQKVFEYGILRYNEQAVTFDLSAYLSSGMNTVRVVATNGAGSASLEGQLLQDGTVIATYDVITQSVGQGVFIDESYEISY